MAVAERYIGQNIRKFRENKRMTQDELGRLVGAAKDSARSYVNHIEHGRSDNISILRLRQFASALQVSVHDILPKEW